MTAETPYHFTDAAKVAILQARHEALYVHAPAVAAHHLALGVLHTLPETILHLLVPDPGNLRILCQALGGSETPAPVIPEDIGYEEAARDALDGATRIAGEGPTRPDTHPLHILLGILRPWCAAMDHASEPGPAALVLAATGLNDARLRDLLPTVLAMGSA